MSDNRPLVLHIPGWLTVVGDRDMVRVSRSTQFDTESEAYASARWFIRVYGLVLDESVEVDDETMHDGRAVNEWYLTPEDRNVTMWDRSA